MNIHKQILEWSKERPAWQRDCLRRLILKGELSKNDLNELTEICKSSHGLADLQTFIPLDKEHIPDEITDLVKVTLNSIFHQHGVNALAENQTLNFGKGLTIVYGDNAAGKTGYIRILKSACRARGHETILGNVLSGGTPYKPVVTIKYTVGTEKQPREWCGEGEDDFISRVSVFDTQCAAVYLTEKTDVAFRPFGLDLFDKLVQVCKAIRLNLEEEQHSLEISKLKEIQTKIPEGTVVANLLSGITSLTKPDKVHALATMSPEEEARFEQLEKSLLDLQANDPEKLIQQMALRIGRVRSLVQHLNEIESALSQKAVESVFNARTLVRNKREEATRIREATLIDGVLKGTGSENWAFLWEAARRFSQESAYPGPQFPFVESGARCVLCQQDDLPPVMLQS